MLIYRQPGGISRSQIEPFFYNAEVFQDRFRAEFRCRPVYEFLEGRACPEADYVIVQPWFTASGKDIALGLEKVRARLPDACLIFLDSFAHNDLRLARFVDPYIDFYFKKSIFKDRHNYLRPRRGDTNLTEYYGSLYGLKLGEPVDWQVPDTILPKLRLFPNFFTHIRFVRGFKPNRRPPPIGQRRLDVQLRLGDKGTPWYTAMREDAQEKIKAISGLRLSPPGKLDLGSFMAELENCKLCFSPFGYGELCWRDIEAFQSGAVLIKPDMSHLDTLPNLYESGVTYLPVRWDFADLEEVVRTALTDEAKMEAIAGEAWTRVSEYIQEARFVEDMAELFDSRG